MNEPAQFATQLLALKRDVDNRVKAAEFAVVQASRQLGFQLNRKACGQKTNDAEIKALRKAIGEARQEKDDAALMKAAIPELLEWARADAQTVQSQQLAAVKLEAGREYEAKKASIQSRLRTLSETQILSDAFELRNIAQRAGRLPEFKATIGEWSSRFRDGVLDRFL